MQVRHLWLSGMCRQSIMARFDARYLFKYVQFFCHRKIWGWINLSHWVWFWNFNQDDHEISKVPRVVMAYSFSSLLFWQKRWPGSCNLQDSSRKNLKGGHLNILGACGDGHPREVSPTLHHPIFQTIGGRGFFLFRRWLWHLFLATLHLYPRFWSGRFRSLAFHQSIWECFIAWLLGFWTCLLAYRIARIYYSVRAAGASVAICALGGPILIFVARLALPDQSPHRISISPPSLCVPFRG